MLKLSPVALLDHPDDSKLADEVFCRIGNLQGAGITLQQGSDDVRIGYINPPKLSKEFRAVYLPYDVLGIVCNGGFDYLFEADYADDPGYVYCEEALREIGYEPALRAFQDAKALVPEGTLRLEGFQRWTKWMAVPEKVRWKVSVEFMDMQDQLIAAIAKYIRDHRSVFEKLPIPKYAQ